MEGLDSISYCMEMLLSAMIFMVYLEKRKNFWLLLTACIPVLFLCSVFIHPFFRVIQNWYNWVWFVIVYIVVILLCHLCCRITPEDSIYCASCGYLVQHIASTLYIQIGRAHV